MAERPRIADHLDAERAEPHRFDPHPAQARRQHVPALMHRAGEHRGQRMRAAVQTEHHGKHGKKAEAHRELCLTDSKRHRP